MLVMRNFGYLGLHSVVNTRSSLARDRLVDFTGEFQLRRKKEGDKGGGIEVDDDGGRVYVAPKWQPDFLAEPTTNGGRNVARLGMERDATSPSGKKGSRSSPKKRMIAGAPLPLYSQELAPVPLSFTPPSGRSSKLSGPSSSSTTYGEDAEICFYTTFCNEFICQPRLLHNCLKRNIVVKVEVRELKWSEWIKSYIVLPPSTGPSIHNPRRGPFLVNEAYTSCAYHTLNPVFLDDFKIKLPLVLEDQDPTKSSLQGKLVLVFSVLNVAVKGKKKWTERLTLRQSSRRGIVSSGDSADAEADDESDKNHSGSSVQQLGCGILPLSVSSDSNSPCLISNGLHDVKIQYISKSAPSSLDIDSLGGTSSPKASSPDSSLRGRNGKTNQDVYPALASGKVSYPKGTLVLDPIKSYPTNSGGDLQQTISSDTESMQTNDESRRTSFGDGEASVEGMGGILTSPANRSEKSAAAPTPMSTSSLSSIARDISSPKQSETMILQVRTVSLSSVHPQNTTLSKFFNLGSNYPRCIKAQELSSPSSPWILPRDDILLRIDAAPEPEADSPSQAMLQTVVELSKSSLCPQSDLSSHLLRILPQLWRALVVGEGEPALSWANPAALIPLRLHSFATLLHSLSSATVYLAKTGVSQLDGRGKWSSLVSMAFVVGMLFDEDDLFLLPDGSPTENLDDVLANDRRRDKVKVKSNDADAAAGSGTKASDASLFAQGTTPDNGNSERRLRKPFDEVSTTKEVHAVSSNFDSLALEGSHLTMLPEKSDATQEPTEDTATSKSTKVDSKADFLAALQKANSVDDETHSPLDGFSSRMSTSGPSVSGNRVAQNMISAFGGMSSGPAGTRRRWMTAPSSALATIQEDADADERKEDEGEGCGGLKEVFTPSLGLNGLGGPSSLGEKKFGNEAFVDKAKRSGTRQMRVPKTQKRRTDSSSSTLPANYAENITEQGAASKPAKALASDDEIESQGTQFLDAIGQSLGLG